VGNGTAVEVGRVIASEGGRVTFARFMELALYHPILGYYRRPGGSRIGRAGDYLTSVSVSSLFGRILARHFLQLQDDLGRPADYEILECGGHAGQLRRDVLAAAPQLRYRVLEVGDELPPTIAGCVFSNELLDALPVHRVRAAQGQWQEIYVQVEEPGFAEDLGPLSDVRLGAYLAQLPAAAMEGYEVEVNLRALEWIGEVARRLRQGFVLSIDYGDQRPGYFSPHRPRGTLRCYYRHQVHADPYARVGEQDITADVDFTALIEEGRRWGLEPVLWMDQAHYLLEIGRELIARIVEDTAGQLSAERAAIHQLLHPGAMGSRFKVLLLRKGG
jgi:SAM-dependent MidA family methyltransferase